MVRSMTAFARQEIKQSWGNASWELRSVNQRYLEPYLRLPEQFRSLEPIVRDRINQKLTRGKIECTLRFDATTDSQQTLMMDEVLAKQIINAAKWIQEQQPNSVINAIDLLRWPGVMTAQEQDLDKITVDIVTALDFALENLIQARESEGASLKKLIEQRLEYIQQEVANIQRAMPDILAWQREKLLSKFAEAEIQVDNVRFEQELMMLAQRIDVTEEIDRLQTHVKETYSILKKPEAIGRRLDFMMQEFNREANTLASKSINSDITAAAIELKVLIEQMREQIQNIE